MHSPFAYSHLQSHYPNGHAKNNLLYCSDRKGATWHIPARTTHYAVEESENSNCISSLFTFFFYGLYGCPVGDVSIALQCRPYVHFAFGWPNASSTLGYF
jgi:hypothetical protein